MGEDLPRSAKGWKQILKLNVMQCGQIEPTGVKLIVEVVVACIKTHPLDRTELFDVQHVLCINGMRIGTKWRRKL